MTSAELRKRFLGFFEKRGHHVVGSSPLVPRQDPTLLFINAGMNQFKNVFLGLEKRDYRRAATVQKCVRAGGKHNDLENVGRTARHHTFFEMLGNFSFGDYFKKEAIDFAWELLVKDLGLTPERLAVTVFEGDSEVPGDDQAAEHWARYLPPDRIYRLGRKDNFWSMGDTGPCGPCSEVHFHQGDHLPCSEPKGCRGLACECDRWMEIWNLVFMQFNRDARGKLESLPAPSVDTGMGLERIAAVVQGVASNYDTDLFQPYLAEIESLTGRRYRTSEADDVSFRVIADHVRATAFLITDGVMPGNEGRGYVLRKIMRRAMRHGKRLGLAEPFLHALTPLVVENMEEAYPELLLSQELVSRVVHAEEERFKSTLATGVAALERLLDEAQKDGGRLAGPEAFKLYDTYGLPLDMLNEIAAERNVTVDEAGFEQEMTEQRRRARESWKKTAVLPDKTVYVSLMNKIEPTRFLGYERTVVEDARVLALTREGQEVPALVEGEEGEIFLNDTPFYAEGGGQVGDRGILAGPDGVADVLDTKLAVPRLYAHRVRIRKGTLVRDQEVLARVDEHIRGATASHHTTTHMLHAALRETLGPHVKQSGSLVAPDRLRFDFSHFAPVQPGELETIERRVNDKIQEDLEVKTEEMPLDKALERGAIAFFGEKYGDRVRVVEVPNFSIELCGGTHLHHTGQAGLFVLTTESSIASGVRRVEALTGHAAVDYIRSQRRLVEGVSKALRAQPEELIASAERLRDELRKREREIEQLKLKLATGGGDSQEERSTEIAGVLVWTPEPLQNYDKKEHRQFMDAFKDKHQKGSWVAISGAINDDKVSVIVEVSPDVKERLRADQLMKRLVPIIEGRGGGKPDRAEAGGRFPERLETLYQEGRKAVREALGG
ncbi:MAG TPA: alanine--tRNA ligase [Vicinamibacteria bacterium]|nr:alanine--tRNA ligase [Vicinamibacteria bacterium]